jgi:hypothetical protein
MFQIDANRVNSRSALANMNQLEAWRRSDVILLNMSQVAQEEAKAGGDPRRSRKATSYIFSITHASTSSDRDGLRAIERALFPNGAAHARFASII